MFFLVILKCKYIFSFPFFVVLVFVYMTFTTPCKNINVLFSKLIRKEILIFSKFHRWNNDFSWIFHSLLFSNFFLIISFFLLNFIDFRIFSSSYHELSCMPWLVACNFSLLVPISWRKHSGPYRLRVGLLLLEERFHRDHLCRSDGESLVCLFRLPLLTFGWTTSFSTRWAGE